jgi:hypothetical protein
MKPERIRHVWRCPVHQKAVFTEPGMCSQPGCHRPLDSFVPLCDLPHVFRCKNCQGVSTTPPEQMEGHHWICPDCKTATVSAWGCSQRYVDRLKEKAEAAECLANRGADPQQKKRKNRFSKTVRVVFEAANSISRAAFQAQQLAERLSQRRPADREDQGGYIDSVGFDIARFNVRAQMVVDMIMVKSLLEESGLETYVSEALYRILDTRLGPRLEKILREVEKSKK